MRNVALLFAAALVASCNSPEPEAPAKPPPATYAIDQATALERLSSASPASWGSLGAPFQHSDGLQCVSRPAFAGDFTICSAPGGQVSSVEFRAMGDGGEEALDQAEGPAEAFMALFESEPYTATDRARILKEVDAALATDREIGDPPHYVAMDTKWVRVERTGYSYQMTARPLDEPGA